MKVFVGYNLNLYVQYSKIPHAMCVYKANSKMTQYLRGAQQSHKQCSSCNPLSRCIFPCFFFVYVATEQTQISRKPKY